MVAKKKKNLGGRPTSMTKAVLDKLRTAFLLGESDENACRYAGIHPATMYNYQNAHPEFLEDKECWKLDPILKAKKTIHDNLSDPNTAKWYLERKRKEEFSAKQEIDLGNINDTPFKIEIVD